MTQDVRNNVSKKKKNSEGNVLERNAGEGSFVGFEKKYASSEELVEWLRHLHAYKYAERFAKGNFVLDLGCGTGYGINELSTGARGTVGIDIWRKGLRYCHLEYGARNSFLAASGSSLPFKDGSFSLVVSFQVIEHIPKNALILYLREIKRVLKNDGVFIVATPNKRLRLLPFQKPWNPDHTKEYNAEALEKLLKATFKKVEILGLFATKDAYIVEYKRVKQTPLIVYVLNPLSSIAVSILPNYVIMILRRFMANKRTTMKEHDSGIMNLNFSSKDFQTSEENLENCIDIYGICTM